MATKEVQSTVATTTEKNFEERATEMAQNVLASMKWFFQKSQKWDDNAEKKPKRPSRAFALTHKDALFAVFIALIIIAWAGFYWWIVYEKYESINSRTSNLKQLSTYNNLTPNESVLSLYIEGNDINTVDGMISVSDNIYDTLVNREEFKQQQKSYYEVLLQNIYLPSLNLRKNPYTQNFDLSILWQKYLEKDKFQDLYLIQYRSDFVKYVGNDADYNVVESISIWDIEPVEDTDYFYIPISIWFTSPNKRSFLLLVNKLSMTSNSNNVALLNEFFFYLLMNIKERKATAINKLMMEYWEEFSTSSNRDGPKNFEDLDEESLLQYQDKVIWYNLYKWLNYNWTGDNRTPLIDDALIVETIRENTLCDNTTSNSECFYNFREKYRNLPYLAYKVWLENQANRTSWLLSFLKDLPSVITITNFWFEKYSNSSFLNNEEEQYQWTLSFNAYWRNISDQDLQETASRLWRLCFWINSDQIISPDMALSRVESTIASLWWSNEAINVTALWELQSVFKSVSETYDELTNYEKMIKLFEIWRMVNDANLCNS